MIKFQCKTFFLAVALFVAFAVLATPTHAQTPEDYYNKKAQKMKTCDGDLDCAARVTSESGAKARAVLNDESEGWSPAEGLMDSTDEELAAMSQNDLIRQLSEAEYFRELDRAKTSLASQSKCGAHWDKAIETRDELDAMNEWAKNKRTNIYAEDAAEIKAANTQAVKDFENCYGQWHGRKPNHRQSIL